MRKVLFATLMLALLSIVPGATPAQEAPAAPSDQQAQKQPPSPEQRVDRMLDRMTQNLSLSDEQREKIRPILLDQVQQMRALRDDTSLSPQDRRAKVRTIRRATRQKVDQILTPEQKAKRRENWQKARGRRSMPPDQPPPQQ